MVMSWVFLALTGLSLVGALITGRGPELGAAVPQGAQAGVTLAISMAGSLCLWSGVGKLLEKIGATAALAKLFRPFLNRVFPSTKTDPALSRALSGNITANLLGLGNAATPMGIQAAKGLAERSPGVASDELCRLVVLNTASIQLIPATVGALRAQLGARQPFVILVPVWITSLLSASAGVLGAWLLGRVWKK